LAGRPVPVIGSQSQESFNTHPAAYNRSSNGCNLMRRTSRSTIADPKLALSGRDLGVRPVGAVDHQEISGPVDNFGRLGDLVPKSRSGTSKPRSVKAVSGWNKATSRNNNHGFFHIDSKMGCLAEQNLIA
jgi:hypothetical protein